MDIVNILISLVVGGGVGGSVLSSLTGMDTSAVAAGGGLDVGGLLGAVGGSAIGGGGLLAIVGVVRNMMRRQQVSLTLLHKALHRRKASLSPPMQTPASARRGDFFRSKTGLET